MMLSRVGLSVLLLLFSAVVQGADAYRNGYWWNGSEFVQDTRFVEAGKFVAAHRVKQVSNSYDLDGAYMLPPLADAHNHNLQTPWLVDNFHSSYIDRGILYGAMLCGSHLNAGEAREGLRRARLASIKVAGACISSSDGHPLAMALASRGGRSETAPASLYDHSYIVVDAVGDIERKWPLIAAGAEDLVKIILVHHEDQTRRGAPEYFGLNGLIVKVVMALVPYLQERGLRVVAHTESAADFSLAVAAGVDWVGHLPGYHWAEGKIAEDYRIAEATARLAAAKGIKVVATAGVVELFKNVSAAEKKRVQNLQKENLELLRTAGVELLSGSDQFQGSVIDELIYLREHMHLDAVALLNTATRVTPKALFPERQVGELGPGFEASFNAYPGNPLADFAVLRKPIAVVQQGEVLRPLAKQRD
ncbi:amidohydrolase family protein [Pseudidiomarina sp. 1APR75-33.1]|uniref:amidohydrolase family protein n=1 Tax=Pseudidiomarina terrestris TaxID=2820060 RepID=UPI0026546621|nr:amidohydrolase family protein [Pseudidiomarina sp. 1APR75-33.1]MDN7128039.1 amidohydrolase family protein [Pseudidiomarina sp. 1APR75-33.1]